MVCTRRRSDSRWRVAAVILEGEAEGETSDDAKGGQEAIESPDDARTSE